MKRDNTFLFCESTGWIVDWTYPSVEFCQDRRRGSTYGKITYNGLKDSGHYWRADLGEGEWYKHSNEVTVLSQYERRIHDDSP